jgi:hypothetical protein
LKGLHDVRHYSDAEQALIMRRLLAPYSCGSQNSGSGAVKPAGCESTESEGDLRAAGIAATPPSDRTLNKPLQVTPKSAPIKDQANTTGGKTALVNRPQAQMKSPAGQNAQAGDKFKRKKPMIKYVNVHHVACITSPIVVRYLTAVTLKVQPIHINWPPCMLNNLVASRI